MMLALLAFASGLSVQPYLGPWRLMEIVGSADMTGATDRQARTLLGKTLSLGPTSASFPGATCSPHRIEPKISIAKVDPILKDDQVWRLQLRLRGDRLDATAPYIEQDCVTAFVTRRGRLIVPAYNGFVYSAVRAHP